jgi:hypothetical protein
LTRGRRRQYALHDAGARAEPGAGRVDDAEIVGQDQHQFGTAERDQLVVALEKLTQALRDGLVLVQEAMVSTKVSVDDWLLTTLSLTYAEREEAAEASAIAATFKTTFYQMISPGSGGTKGSAIRLNACTSSKLMLPTKIQSVRHRDPPIWRPEALLISAIDFTSTALAEPGGWALGSVLI